jgi:hypothetical protein
MMIAPRAFFGWPGMDETSPQTPGRPNAPLPSPRREVIRRAKLGRKWEKREAASQSRRYRAGKRHARRRGLCFPNERGRTDRDLASEKWRRRKCRLFFV